MRIAINTRFLLPGKLEGFGWYTHELASRLVARHPDDEFLFLFDRPFDPRFVYGSNVEARVVFPPARHPLLWYIWYEHRLPAILRNWKADVFFSPDSYCSLNASTPTVMTTHDLVPLHSPQQLPPITSRYLLYWLPRYLHRAEKVVTVSNYVAHDLSTTAKLPPNRVKVIYNGCRTIFRPLTENEKQTVRQQYTGGIPYFFYSGAIHPRKNLTRLIRAFDVFKTRTGAPIKLLLAGRMAWQTGDVHQALDQAVHKADIHPLGYVTDEELARLLGAAHALTYVSLSEGFGLPLIEAMACDVPVITAKATALPEIAGNAALLVDPYSEADITTALERIYTDPGLCTRLVENGRLRRADFSWDRAADELYHQLTEVDV